MEDKYRQRVKQKLNSTFIIIKIVLLLSVLAIISSCSSGTQQISSITYKTNIDTFKVTVDGVGILEAKNNKKIITPRSLNYRVKVEYLIPEGTIVNEGDVVIQLSDSRLNKSYKSTLDEIEVVKADAKKRKAELNEERVNLESQLKSIERSNLSREAKLKKIEFVAPLKQKIERIEIQKNDIEIQKIQRRLEALKKIQKEEMTSLQLKVKQVENKLQKYQRFLDALDIKAPQSGMITHERNRRTGKKVAVGDEVSFRYPLARIPDLSVMQVRMLVSETDSQKLEKGQTTEVRISSIGNFVLPGKVEFIDKVAKPVMIDYEPTKIKKVEIVVEIDSSQAAIMPGFTAECSVIIEKQDSTISIPKECVFEKDSSKVVYIFKGKHFQEQLVEVSAQSEDFVVISSGLQEGLNLATKQPDISQIKQ